MNALLTLLTGILSKVIGDLIKHLLERPAYKAEITHANLPVEPAKDIVKKYQDLIRI